MNFRLLSQLASAILICLLSSSAFGAVMVLPKYNVSVNDISVSGLSYGAYMAAQMHFAYSKTIKKGAGIVAGGPVYCSQGSAAIALGPCMADTGPRSLPYLEAVINTWSGNGYIDPTRFSPVWPRRFVSFSYEFARNLPRELPLGTV